MKSLPVSILLLFQLSNQLCNSVVASPQGFQESKALEKTSNHANSARLLSMEDLFSASSYPIDKSLVDSKLGTDLTKIYDVFVTSVASLGPSSPQEQNTIAVDISFKNEADRTVAKKELSTVVEAEIIDCYARMCSARVPVSSLMEIAAQDSVLSVRLAKSMTHVGAVTSEGDLAMFSNIARTKYALNGTDLMIGVLSDSFNCLGGASNDTRTGDLPDGDKNIVIISDLSPADCIAFHGTDEGRGMMQLIHDVAPGARLAFHTAQGGEANFASGILALAAAGCDVIVDDIIYLAEPMLQDGVVAQAVDQVVSQGISYFSAAGNAARSSWIAPNGFIPVDFRDQIVHQFGVNKNGSPITRMQMKMQGGNGRNFFVFQWDEAYASVSGLPGSRSDIDVNFYVGGNLIARGSDDNILGDPVEIVSIDSSAFSSNSTVTVEFEIVSVKSPLPKFMKLVVFGDVTFEFPTNSSTSYGHSNSALGAGVGAAAFFETPAFGVSPPRIEFFSAAGGTPIFFNTLGNRLPSPELRNQPRFVGPDGGVTTFFGSKLNGISRFFGTSAAAPHVAAVAALMLQRGGGKKSLKPEEVYSTLGSTAIDMDDPFTTGFDVGFDFGTGLGLVNASAALDSIVPLASAPALPIEINPTAAPVVLPPTSPAIPPSVPVTATPTSVPVTATPTTAPVTTTSSPVVVPFTPTLVVAPAVPTPVAVQFAPTLLGAPPYKTPMSVPVANKPSHCGLFGWSIFCPFTLCGILGRYLGFCVN